jgi:hypothetical protein
MLAMTSALHKATNRFDDAFLCVAGTNGPSSTFSTFDQIISDNCVHPLDSGERCRRAEVVFRRHPAIRRE